MTQAPWAGPEALLAQSLAHAHATGHALGHVESEIAAALTLDQAYHVQQAVFELRGLPLAGYKLAATSLRAQEAMGLDGPLVGRITAPELVACPLAVPMDRPVYAEAELLVRIGDDLPVMSDAPSLARMAEAVDRVWLGLEICSSRFADDDLSPSGIVADNGLLNAIVTGDLLANGWSEELAEGTVVLQPEGAEPVYGAASAVMGHPLLALGWLAAWLGRRGEHLRRHQIIACGSMTGITQIASDKSVTAQFGTPDNKTAGTVMTTFAKDQMRSKA
ncbi:MULTISPECIES: 2-keto-4-pentenoate hydratase [unclassified Novosphingobium]|uniref:2-keto-4-pentenoate hydratase n=1 Tax=unclassified Novosphingobium TaxID=2644732 RepID=UPI00086F4D09|nr:MULTISPECIES: hypothetical protein [unclassified Novosphingobium]MDR6707577.1 2-keto-4-pentenoate hydratase [Novosphingobium sp. 1748]ODU79073.1 MAG: hypothetical protein ABT10_21465 [Novosphingobium sp. SCN 63-17]OJX96255.1 MAG: hypothetical protein BGP00_16800 [Novosphingobium sp. 63-713]